MTTPETPPSAGATQRIRWATVLGIALLTYLTVFALLAGTTWVLEGEVEFLTTAALAMATTALIVLLVPISFLGMFYILVFTLSLLVFVGCDDIPLSGWPGRVRTLLRS